MCVQSSTNSKRDETKSFAEPDGAFAPLVTRPRKIICVGFNYRAHAAETGTEVPKAPPLFSKFINALNHHDGIVELPTAVDHEFDYETELVVVFERKCKNVSEQDALSVVAGYCVGNDISARGLQNVTSQFMAGKMSDGFAPLGPWLATRRLIPEPNNLRLQTRLNGEIRQDSNTSEMIFDCRKIISYVTSIATIEPGDILFTGTPPGVIWGQKIPREERQWLKAGDRVVSSIEGLGELAVDFR
jgi:2-keto-4-pentenoate hydratase/2-oxohepta-3-ene-1,7-dioic acid hydratase in catechol pathway